MEEVKWKEVIAFQLGWTSAARSPILFIKLEDDKVVDLTLSSILELHAVAEVLRSGTHIMFCEETQEFRFGWEDVKTAAPAFKAEFP